MKIDAISDLHGNFPFLDGGDVLIVCGDLTAKNEPSEYHKFFSWLVNQDYEKKVITFGNHDKFIEEFPGFFEKDYKNIDYLIDSGIEYKGLKIWGSPFTHWFPEVNPNCDAFMESEIKLGKRWEKIPKDIDILVTHGPALGILDKSKDHYGSKSLRKVLDDHQVKIHVFGHIHEQGGKTVVFRNEKKNIERKCFNCSLVNEHYEAVNYPIRILE